MVWFRMTKCDEWDDVQLRGSGWTSVEKNRDKLIKKILLEEKSESHEKTSPGTSFWGGEGGGVYSGSIGWCII